VSLAEIGLVGYPANALQAVVAIIDVSFGGGYVVREDESAFFGDEEEEEPVDEPKQLAVEHVRFEVARSNFRAQGFVVGMGQKTVGKAEDGLFYGLAESVPDAGTLVEGVLVVFLDQAGGGG